MLQRTPQSLLSTTNEISKVAQQARPSKEMHPWYLWVQNFSYQNKLCINVINYSSCLWAQNGSHHCIVPLHQCCK